MANDESSNDAQVLATLAESGHDLTQPMLIEFEVLTKTEQAAEAIADAAEQAGFGVHVYAGQQQAEPSSDPKEPLAEQILWVCVCSVSMVADKANLATTRQRLSSVTEELGGRIDSWGTFGNANENPGR